MNLFLAPLLIFIIFFSIALHEYSHGWVAHRLGDPTPKLSGRLTLNPLAHLDLFGTLILPFSLLLISARFGQPITVCYAKPLPVNPYHFKNHKQGVILVSLAGPLANFSLAVFLSVLWRTKTAFFAEIIIWGILINLLLAIFNLIPVPPLDGARIAASFLPREWADKYLKIRPYGFFILALLILLGISNWLILPVLKLIFSLLGMGGVL